MRRNWKRYAHTIYCYYRILSFNFKAQTDAVNIHEQLDRLCARHDLEWHIKYEGRDVGIKEKCPPHK